MTPCKYCGQLTQNKMFCGGSCTGKYYTTTPEGRAKFYTKERAEKVANACRQRMKDRPELKVALRQRMLTCNPMRHAECRQAVSRALAGRPWPSVRGGNGTGPSRAEKVLMELFPDAIWNHGVKTGLWNGSGYPPVYKVDIAFPSIKLAVEADGLCHNTPFRREKDHKKQEYLEELGWTVLRYSNKQIFQNPTFVQADIQCTILRLQGTPATLSSDLSPTTAK